MYIYMCVYGRERRRECVGGGDGEPIIKHMLSNISRSLYSHVINFRVLQKAVLLQSATSVKQQSTLKRHVAAVSRS
jgi:hypothetical protein